MNDSPQEFEKIPEAEVIARAQGGNVNAFGHLVKTYRKKVYTLAFQMTHNHADADEVSQEAFIKAFQSLDKFRGDAHFFTWMYRITMNICFNHFRKQKRERPLLDPLLGDSKEHRESCPVENPGKSLEKREVKQIVWNALAELTEEIRAAVVLVYLQDIKPKEAAITLGCAEATVHWRLYRARDILKRILKYKLEV